MFIEKSQSVPTKLSFKNHFGDDVSSEKIIENAKNVRFYLKDL